MSLARRYFAFQGFAGFAWWIAVFQNEPLRRHTLGHLPLELAYLDLPLFALASLLAVRLRGAAWAVLVWTALVSLGMAVYATVTREAAWGMLLMAAALAGTALAAAQILLGRVPTDWLARGPFVFRPTPDARGHLARTLRQLVAFWVAFLVVLPLVVVTLERRWRLDVPFPVFVRLAGVALFLAASALGVASSLVMARRGEGTPLPCTTARLLVVAGPYRVVRNPMAVAGIAQGAAVGLMLGSWLVVAYALVGSAVWNGAIRPHEEADLAARFGAEFDAYRKNVDCWWPKGIRARDPSSIV